jgi:hypothetical protein
MSPALAEEYELHRLQENSSGGVILKGTGFSPYINAGGMKRALAPEG